MSITGAGTDFMQVLGVATLTMGHVACTDHVVWLAETYRARYAAQPQSLCGSVSLGAINFNANLRKNQFVTIPNWIAHILIYISERPPSNFYGGPSIEF